MYRRLFAGLLVICMLCLCACDTVIPPQTDNPEQPTQSLEPEQTPAPHTTVPTPSVTSSTTVPEGTGSDVAPDSDEPGGSVSVVTPSPEPTPQMPDVTPPLWKITGEDGEEVYILGSVETADGELYPMPTYIMDIFAKCPRLGVLTNFPAYEKDTKRQLAMADLLLNPDGKTLDSIIDEDLFNSCRDFLNRFKRYNTVYDYYNGAFWYKLMCDSLIAGGPLSLQNSPETWFLKRAEIEKKEILEIQPTETWYDILNSFSQELTEFLLAYTASTPSEDYYSRLKSRYSHYLKGNLEKLEQDTKDRAIAFTDYALEDEYTEKAVNVRRNDILDVVIHTLEGKDTAFYVLDLDYLLGSEGLLADLAGAGYRVETVEPAPEPLPTPAP